MVLLYPTVTPLTIIRRAGDDLPKVGKSSPARREDISRVRRDHQPKDRRAWEQNEDKIVFGRKHAHSILSIAAEKLHPIFGAPFSVPVFYLETMPMDVRKPLSAKMPLVPSLKR